MVAESTALPFIFIDSKFDWTGAAGILNLDPPRFDPFAAPRVRAEWGGLSFRRGLLALSGLRLDWRVVEGVALKEEVKLGEHSKVQLSLHEGRAEVKKFGGVSVHYKPDEDKEANLAFANSEANGESFTLSSSYALTPTLSLGSRYATGRPKQEQVSELKVSRKGKANSGALTASLKKDEQGVKVQLQHGLGEGIILKNSFSATTKRATQWVVDAQLPVSSRTSIAQKISTNLRSKDRVEWKAQHKLTDVARFEAAFATDLKQERKISVDIKLPVAGKRELQTRIVADEHWKRKLRIQFKEAGNSETAYRWGCSFSHDPKEGQNVLLELARKLDVHYFVEVKASTQGRTAKVQFELRAPDS